MLPVDLRAMTSLVTHRPPGEEEEKYPRVYIQV